MQNSIYVKISVLLKFNVTLVVLHISKLWISCARFASKGCFLRQWDYTGALIILFNQLCWCLSQKVIQLAVLERVGSAWPMRNKACIFISGRREGSRFSVAEAGLLGKKGLSYPIYLSGFIITYQGKLVQLLEVLLHQNYNFLCFWLLLPP